MVLRTGRNKDAAASSEGVFSRDERESQWPAEAHGRRVPTVSAPAIRFLSH